MREEGSGKVILGWLAMIRLPDSFQALLRHLRSSNQVETGLQSSKALLSCAKSESTRKIRSVRAGRGVVSVSIRSVWDKVCIKCSKFKQKKTSKIRNEPISPGVCTDVHPFQ